MTESQCLNPSKRHQEDQEDSILIRLQKEIEYWEAKYSHERKLAHKWKCEAWDVEKKRNERRLLSILFGVIIILLIIIKAI